MRCDVAYGVGKFGGCLKMFYLKNIAALLSLKDQLPGYSVVATDDFIGIDGIDYRINCYGWPDNRITVEDKVTGLNSIKSFGAKGAMEAKRHYREMLERFGVDTGALDHMTTT